MNYNKWNNLLGWACGLIAALIYVSTADRFNSWWDTGEFIASAYKLEIVHQPGAPLFLMLQNILSNLAFGDTSRIAFWMNVGSALYSALTIVFLFWTITALAKKIQPKGEAKNSALNQGLILGAGVVGSLSYAFTDTFWYSAVESEVYAMSSLCTAIVFWMVLKWEARADQQDANRWLLAVAFVMGLSIAVHLLNLLTIPALGLVIYFKKVKKPTLLGILKTLGLGVIVLAFILWGIIQYTVKGAAYFDLFFVNSLGLSFGTGIVFFVLCLASMLIYAIVYSIKKHKPIVQLVVLAICFVLFGFSSYTMLIIRSQTNISLNNASPDNVFSFLGYLSREQYSSEPLLKGPIYTSEIVGVQTKESFHKDVDKYRPVEVGATYTYDKEMLFPRIYSHKHGSLYNHYLSLGSSNPTFIDNLKFFFSYQVNHMYLRYLMWNFVGRQNDVQGHGGKINGNWLSGINILDSRLAGQDTLSDAMKADPSRNTYFFLPLILGCIGLIWQLKNQKKDALVTGLLFFFTGLAIVIYLNQTPMQPRERDYAYAGSFYIFAIWIGLGVLGLGALLKKMVAQKIAMQMAFSLALLGGPIILLVQNWDDHDRSDRQWTRDMAYNYLESCEPNAILFTYADNDTFPLWYLQEVEGIRTDVRIVNLSYLQSDWYIKQAMEDINKAKALPMEIPFEKVKKGVRDVLYVQEMGIDGYTDLATLLKIMLSDNESNQVQLTNGKYVNILPTKKIQLQIDKDTVVRNRVVPASWNDHITTAMKWTYNKEYVTKAELGVMAILAHNNWERPIYFANMLSTENFIGLDKYLVNEGMVYRLMPIDVQQQEDRVSLVNEDSLYRNIMEKYKLGNIAQLNHYDTDYKIFVNRYLWEETIALALDTLNKKGDLTKSNDIAQLAWANIPRKIINTQQVQVNSYIVDTLLRVKDNNKALKLAEVGLDYLDQRFAYLESIGKGLSGFDVNELQLAVDTLDRYKYIASLHGNTNLITRINNLEARYVNKYE